MVYAVNNEDMTPVKQESAACPSTPSSALGARIAKYAYTSPAKSPARNRTPNPILNPTKTSPVVKLEAKVGASRSRANGQSGRVELVGRESPYFSPVVKTEQTEWTERSERGDRGDRGRGRDKGGPVEAEESLVPGPIAGPSRSTSTGGRTRNRDPDSVGLESTEGDLHLQNVKDEAVQDVPLRRSTRTISQLVSIEPFSEEIHRITSDSDSDSESESESDLSEPPPPRIQEEIPRRRQTRILASRASRDQRVLARSRARREDTSSEHDDDDDDEDIPPAPIITSSTSSPGSRPRSGTRNGNGNGVGGGRTRPRGYAGPEMYQHMRPLPDILAPDLDGTSRPLSTTLSDEEGRER